MRLELCAAEVRVACDREKSPLPCRANPGRGQQSIFGPLRSTLLAARLLVPQFYAKRSAACAQPRSVALNCIEIRS